MSREEIIAKIDELKEREFMIQMKDHWSSDDYERSRNITDEIHNLKKALVAISE